MFHASIAKRSNNSLGTGYWKRQASEIYPPGAVELVAGLTASFADVVEFH